MTQNTISRNKDVVAILEVLTRDATYWAGAKWEQYEVHADGTQVSVGYATGPCALDTTSDDIFPVNSDAQQIAYNIRRQCEGMNGR